MTSAHKTPQELRELMEKGNMKPKDVSKVTGRSLSTISLYMNGKVKIPYVFFEYLKKHIEENS